MLCFPVQSVWACEGSVWVERTYLNKDSPEKRLEILEDFYASHIIIAHEQQYEQWYIISENKPKILH
jgi:hypothetical protein